MDPRAPRIVADLWANPDRPDIRNADDVARELGRLGIPPPHGREWTGPQVIRALHEWQYRTEE